MACCTPQTWRGARTSEPGGWGSRGVGGRGEAPPLGRPLRRAGLDARRPRARARLSLLAAAAASRWAAGAAGPAVVDSTLAPQPCLSNQSQANFKPFLNQTRYYDVWKALHADYDIEKRFEALKAKVGGVKGARGEVRGSGGEGARGARGAGARRTRGKGDGGRGAPVCIGRRVGAPRGTGTHVGKGHTRARAARRHGHAPVLPSPHSAHPCRDAAAPLATRPPPVRRTRPPTHRRPTLKTAKPGPQHAAAAPPKHRHAPPPSSAPNTPAAPSKQPPPSSAPCWPTPSLCWRCARTRRASAAS